MNITKKLEQLQRGNLKKKGILISLLSTGIISLAPVINKFALMYMDSFQAALLNTLFVVLLALLYKILEREKFKFDRNATLWMVGLFEAFGTVCLYISLELLNPLIFGLVNRFSVVFAILLSVVFLKEKISRKEMLLITAMITGAVAFVSKGFVIPGLMGLLFALLYTLFFALSNMLAKISVKNTSSVNILIYSKTFALVFIFVYILLRGHTLSLTNSTGIMMIFLSAVVNFFGLLLAFEAFKWLGFSEASIIRSISPILVAIYAYPFFPIDLSLVNMIGGAVLLVSVTLLTINRNTKT